MTDPSAPAVTGKSLYMLYCETYMQHIMVFFKFYSESISSSWVSHILLSTKLIYALRKNLESRLFFKPVICRLLRIVYASFSVPVGTAGETLWKRCRWSVWIPCSCPTFPKMHFFFYSYTLDMVYSLLKSPQCFSTNKGIPPPPPSDKMELYSNVQTQH